MNETKNVLRFKNSNLLDFEQLFTLQHKVYKVDLPDNDKR